MADRDLQKNGKKTGDFFCKKCNFTTKQKSDYERHLMTAKHKRLTLKEKKTGRICETIIAFECECGKIYKQRQSLHKHKKKCTYVENRELEDEEGDEEGDVTDKNADEISIVDENLDIKKMLYEVVTSQQEQISKLTDVVSKNSQQMVDTQKQIMETQKLVSANSVTNNTTNNTINNNFNLNVFLNENCKDALNLTDFINSIKCQLTDLEYTAEHGHIKGITQIFKNALTNLEVTKRPMHCTDLKREILYVKDNDEWYKDDTKGEIKTAINKVVDKNLGNTGKWLEKYPDHCNTDSNDFNNYIKMAANSYGTGEEKETNKVVKNIMKEIIIDKEK